MQCQLDGLPDGNHVLTVENLSSQRLDLDQAIVSNYVNTNATSSAAPTAATSTSTSPSNLHSKTAVIIGSVVGVIFMVLIALSGWLFAMRRRRSRLEAREKIDLGEEVTAVRNVTHAGVEDGATVPFLRMSESVAVPPVLLISIPDENNL